MPDHKRRKRSRSRSREGHSKRHREEKINNLREQIHALTNIVQSLFDTQKESISAECVGNQSIPSTSEIGQGKDYQIMVFSLISHLSIRKLRGKSTRLMPSLYDSYTKSIRRFVDFCSSITNFQQLLMILMMQIRRPKLTI